MGQQQIILLVLVTVVAGIATIVAINTLEASRRDANIDAIRNDLHTAVIDAQAYYYRFKTMGGGGNSFDGININHLSIASENENASYKITGAEQEVKIKAKSVYKGIKLQLTATMQESGGKLTLEWKNQGVIWEE